MIKPNNKPNNKVKNNLMIEPTINIRNHVQKIISATRKKNCRIVWCRIGLDYSTSTLLVLLKEINMIRVEPDSKYRCQGSLQSGQCEYKAEPGFKYCNRHGGRSFLAEKKDKVNMYKLKQWQERHKQLKEDPSVKSLRDELGLLRILIEERMLQCDSPLELMTHTPIISDLIIKATNVVLACQKIEGAMGLLVDKQALLQFADAVIRIIGTEVKDPAQLESIASQIMATLNEPTTTDSVADIERDTA